MTDAYLDHAASTPVRPEAVAAMTPLLGSSFGNPSGSHHWAREARRLLDDARDQVADALGVSPSEVVFTSGGTEADNTAVMGVVAARGGRALCSAVEHSAVLEPVKATGGVFAPVDGAGRLDLDALAGLLTANPDITLVSAMTANNETGAVQDLSQVADVVRSQAPKALLHTDAVAAAPWIDLAPVSDAVDLLTVSAHKLGGPKGIGALVVRTGTKITPLVRGGGQEQERRSGTPNVMGAVGFAAALSACVANRDQTVARTEALRHRLIDGLVAAAPDAVVVSPPSATDRTAGTVLVCFPGIEREALLFLLDQAGLGASWGSSCASGASEPSHVLAAMGVPSHVSRGALRLSLGWSSTDADVDAALAAVPAAVNQLRGGDPVPAGAPEVGAIR
ncbi:MAG: cysteine desulfurase family protein [Aquihabitans sp.]